MFFFTSKKIEIGNWNEGWTVYQIFKVIHQEGIKHHMLKLIVTKNVEGCVYPIGIINQSKKFRN